MDLITPVDGLDSGRFNVTLFASRLKLFLFAKVFMELRFSGDGTGQFVDKVVNGKFIVSPEITTAGCILKVKMAIVDVIAGGNGDTVNTSTSGSSDFFSRGSRAQGAQGVAELSLVKVTKVIKATKGIKGTKDIKDFKVPQEQVPKVPQEQVLKVIKGTKAIKDTKVVRVQQVAQAHKGLQGRVLKGIKDIKGFGATGTGAQGATGSGAQGYQGYQGNDGNFGGVTFAYSFNSDTADSDPGVVNLNLISVQRTSNRLYIDDTDANGTDIQSYMRTIDDSTSTIKVTLVSNKLDSTQFLLFTISALTENVFYNNDI